MQNPHNNKDFEIDYAICSGKLGDFLNDIIANLIHDGSDESGHMTEFACRMYECIGEAKQLLTARTEAVERKVLEYDLYQRLEKIKEEEDVLRKEYEEKRKRLELIRAEKPQEPAELEKPAAEPVQVDEESEEVIV